MDKKNRHRKFQPFQSDQFQKSIENYPRSTRTTPDYSSIRATAIDIGLAWEERDGGVPICVFAPDTRMPLKDNWERGPWQDMHRKVLHAVEVCEQCQFDLGALLESSPWGPGETIISLQDLATHSSSQGRLAQRVVSTLLAPPAETGEELTGPERLYQQAAFDLLWGLAVEAWGTQSQYLRRPGLIGGSTIKVGRSSQVHLIDDGIRVYYGRPRDPEDDYTSSLRILFPVDRRLLPSLDTWRENLPITGKEEPDIHWESDY
ncbi:hypothetical protein [Deinococcus sp. QL22]|uniref:hypothetical protein n=1 Tax=Deinococcus sp. QL22 TaxID=2939437 RepID=UPI0020182A10|nr:hypothetical protein [Deinococcus sp. QL22]UQN08807.1 hypothetical protein M1R55_19565 [Deinococcus sp. QL22]